MKLPDFSTFKPLNENREQMNADLPENLSFVTIDDRLTNADLEKKAASQAAQPATQKQQAKAHAPGVRRQAAPPPAPSVSLTTILLAVQLVLLVDAAVAAAAFSYFGIPWAKPAAVYPLCQMPPAKAIHGKPGDPDYDGPLEPFYKRNEYWDKNGVRHTIIEQLPGKK